MEYQLKKVTTDDKDLLFNLLQFALYDGSQYIDNEINKNALFEYEWFNNYFTDKDRYAYLILEKSTNEIIGFTMINQYMKFFDQGHNIAEFLILPKYRRNHIGKEVAFEIFDLYKGNWEVSPIENSEQADKFWNKTIREYTNNKYDIKNKILIFSNIDK